MKYKKERAESQNMGKPDKPITFYEKADKLERMKM